MNVNVILFLLLLSLFSNQTFVLLCQLHPDTSGKQDHADFVRLNEAYMILGKETTRRQYDFDLKYNRYRSSYIYNPQNM